MTIFVITVVEDNIEYRKRTVEWHSTLEAAKQSVLHNSANMCEGATNRWAVIEEVPEGFPYDIKEHCWFEWVGGFKGKYVECLKPTFSDGIINWSIG